MRPLAGVSDLTQLTQLNATAPATFTGQPSFVAQVTTAAFQILRGFTDFATAIFGVDTAIPIARLLTSVDPPWFTTLGLNAQRSEFEGMPVWTLQSANPSGRYVVGIHGGAAIFQPSIFNWIDYAAMARNTGATVIVPIYPLAPQGTAATVVPTMADLISSQIDQHGAENVSVYGDSAGGNIGLAAVQELVRRGDPVPSHMVLISPALDLTFSNPAMQFIDDPVLSPEICASTNNGLATSISPIRWSVPCTGRWLGFRRPRSTSGRSTCSLPMCLFSKTRPWRRRAPTSPSSSGQAYYTSGPLFPGCRRLSPSNQTFISSSASLPEWLASQPKTELSGQYSEANRRSVDASPHFMAWAIAICPSKPSDSAMAR